MKNISIFSQKITANSYIFLQKINPIFSVLIQCLCCSVFLTFEFFSWNLFTVRYNLFAKADVKLKFRSRCDTRITTKIHQKKRNNTNYSDSTTKSTNITNSYTSAINQKSNGFKDNSIAIRSHPTVVVICDSVVQRLKNQKDINKGTIPYFILHSV